LNKLKTASTIKATIAQYAYNGALMLSPIGWFAAGILLISGAFALYKKGADDAANGTRSFAADISEALGSIVSLFKSLFDLLKSLLTAVINIIGVIVKLSLTAFKLFSILNPTMVQFRIIIKLIDTISKIFELVATAIE
jgi:hypothetical protein